MIPKHQQIPVCPKHQKKKKARLRYDNVFKTAWTDEFHFIKHSRKGNKFAFCEFCRTDFSINHGGHSDVTKHVGTAKYKGNATDLKKKNVRKILELVQGYCQYWKFCIYNQRKKHKCRFV